MTKELKYGGYSASPGDHEALEGDLAVAMNLIPERGTIRPVLPPAPVFDHEIPNGYTIMCIHKVNYRVSGVDYNLNYICWQPANNGLYRIYEDGSVPYDGGMIKTFGTDVTIRKVEPVGNTLVVLASDGIHYILWKNGAYNYLGTHLPELDLKFSLQNGMNFESDEYKVEWDLTGYSDFVDSMTPFWWFDSDEQPSSQASVGRDVGSKLRQGIMAALNSVVADTIKEKLFAFPFFVRYGFRMYDGSVTMHSTPELLVPTLNSPSLSMGWAGISSDLQKVKGPARIKASVDAYELHCRPLDVSQVERLAQWSDIVAGVDIYISPLFYTYNQGAKDRDIEISADTQAPRNTQLESSICSNGAFYLLKQIRLSSDMPQHNSLLRYSGGKVDFGFEPSNDNIVVRELMSDDYGTHDEIIAEKAFAYNNRINLAGVKKKLFNGFNPACFWYREEDTETSTTTATVVIETNGREITVQSAPGEITYSMRSSNKVLWFFYPNPAAKRAYVTVDGDNVELELTPHPMLNGAFFCSLDEEAVQQVVTYIPSPSTDEQRIIPQPNKVYTSEVNNPFFFPSTGINTIGASEIYGICAAVRPVSTGQMGYADLYIFADNGVWVAKINEKGSYSNITLATGDVCINPESITQMETSVLFTTDRGIMLISGSQAQCISDAIDDKNQLVPIIDQDGESIPVKIAGLLGMEMEPVGSFEYFVAGCRMLYDYRGQRIIVYNPGYSYAYIYSLESNKWGMMWSNIGYGVRDYPNTLAVTQDNRLVNFCEPAEAGIVRQMADQVLVTRPITLGLPDVLKTIDTVIQRGMFPHWKGSKTDETSHVTQILYGSRDLHSWHLVSSSVNEYMRGFSGTPYKWYRIALLLSLEPHESIQGCSIRFNTKYTNRLR